MTNREIMASSSVIPALRQAQDRPGFARAGIQFWKFAVGPVFAPAKPAFPPSTSWMVEMSVLQEQIRTLAVAAPTGSFFAPSPWPSPTRGEGIKTGFRLSPE